MPRNQAIGMNSESWLESVDVNAIPVQVVAWQEDRAVISIFPNLAVARQTFPELDPHNSTSEFTWAMRGEIDDAPALRFETWAAYDVFSA